LAAALLEKETLDGKQIEEILVRVRKTEPSPA
jgi:ATP-dependent Zn protease